jgi:hypothetical protein
LGDRISDNPHYPSYYYRVFSVWDGLPLRIDFATWMDLAYIGVDEQDVMRFVKDCTVRTWILPIGAPFTMVNYYTQQPLLSEAFRRTFLTNYRLVKTGQAYQIWACNRS